MAVIDRQFVRLNEGEMLVRRAVPAAGGSPWPLFMMHACPASGASLGALMGRLGEGRACWLPDTPGLGDSAPLTMPEPGIEDYAEAMIRILDALGLGKVDLYGTHTGAHLAIEMAIAAPERVNRVVLDGVLILEDEAQRAEFLENYAPPVPPDPHGAHLLWAWHFVRDQSLHFPWYRRTAETRLDVPVMPVEVNDRIALDVVKALGSFRHAYRAVFRQEVRDRLPKVKRPTLVIEDEADPLRVHAAQAAGLVPHAGHAVLPMAADPDRETARAALISEFLDRTEA